MESILLKVRKPNNGSKTWNLGIQDSPASQFSVFISSYHTLTNTIINNRLEGGEAATHLTVGIS